MKVLHLVNISYFCKISNRKSPANENELRRSKRQTANTANIRISRMAKDEIDVEQARKKDATRKRGPKRKQRYIS